MVIKQWVSRAASQWIEMPEACELRCGPVGGEGPWRKLDQFSMAPPVPDVKGNPTAWWYNGSSIRIWPAPREPMVFQIVRSGPIAEEAEAADSIMAGLRNLGELGGTSHVDVDQTAEKRSNWPLRAPAPMTRSRVRTIWNGAAAWCPEPFLPVLQDLCDALEPLLPEDDDLLQRLIEDWESTAGSKRTVFLIEEYELILAGLRALKDQG